MDFGFWILDFGLDEALLDIVWILHKIFPCHADSGRRIIIIFLNLISFLTNIIHICLVKTMSKTTYVFIFALICVYIYTSVYVFTYASMMF